MPTSIANILVTLSIKDKRAFLWFHLPSILLRSVFSRSGLSCARRLRSSLVQMMKAFRGLLTRVSGVGLVSGLEQLSSDSAEAGLEGPETETSGCSDAA